MDPEFQYRHMSRLLNWEILNRRIRLQDSREMSAYELCDNIGVHRNYVRDTLKSARKTLHV
jgi:predicted DNA-binding protein (UPF0251 family)